MRSFACMVSVLALAAAVPALAVAEPAAPAPTASAPVTPYTAAQFFETTSFSMANPDGLAFSEGRTHVLISSDKTLGTPSTVAEKTGVVWTHFTVELARAHRHPLLTAPQVAAERREDYKILQHCRHTFPLHYGEHARVSAWFVSVAPRLVRTVWASPSASRAATTPNPMEKVDRASRTPMLAPNTQPSCRTVSDRPKADAREASGRSDWMEESRHTLPTADPAEATNAVIEAVTMVVAEPVTSNGRIAVIVATVKHATTTHTMIDGGLDSRRRVPAPLP